MARASALGGSADGRGGGFGWPAAATGHPAATTGLVVATAALALLPLPFNVAAAVGLATAILTLLRPTWGLYLVLLSVPIQDLAAPRLGDTALTATKILVPLALVAWLALRLARGGWRLAPSWLTLPYGLYVAAMAGSTIVAISQFAALVETSRWLQAFGIFLMTLDLVRTRRELAGIAICLLVGGVSQAGLGLVQSTLGAGPASFAVAAGYRAYGTFGMPNSYAGYLEMTLPLAVAAALGTRYLSRPVRGTDVPGASTRLRPGPRWRDSRLWAGLAALLLAAGIYFSFSRGAWLGTMIGLALMIVVASQRTRISGLVVALLVASGLGLGGSELVPATVTERLSSIVESMSFRDVRTMVVTDTNWAVAERMAMWQAGLGMFDAHPIYGVGAGNFNVVYSEYSVPQFPYSRGHAHNYYIHVGAETGAVGLIAYGLVLLGAWVDIGRGLRHLRDRWLRGLVVGVAGILAAVMIHNLVENLHVLNMNLHFFAALAIPALALRLEPSATRPRPIETGSR